MLTLSMLTHDVMLLAWFAQKWFLRLSFFTYIHTLSPESGDTSTFFSFTVGIL